VTYDLATPDNDPSEIRGEYTGTASTWQLGSHAPLNLPFVDLSVDTGRFGVSAGPIGEEFVYDCIALELALFSDAAFASSALPTSLSLEDLSGSYLRLVFLVGRDPIWGIEEFAEVEGEITSLTLPEPGGTAPGLAALSALVGARRHRRELTGSRRGSGLARRDLPDRA
jgi:hypothetical protein